MIKQATTTSRPVDKRSAFGTMWTALFTLISLLLLVALGELIHQPLIIPPLAATAGYIFGAPSTPGTQPRSVIGGNLTAAIVGFGLLALLGSSPWVAALAAGVVFIGMNGLKLFHIPSVAVAALVILLHPKEMMVFLINLVVGSMFLCLMGFILASLTKKLRYPVYL